MLDNVLYYHGDEGDCEYGCVEVDEEERFVVGMVRKNVLQQPLAHGLGQRNVDRKTASQLTLARKFDAVQRNTVRSSNAIPNVRRATPNNPNFARQLLPLDPVVNVLRVLRTEEKEAPISMPLPDCDRRLLLTWWYSGPGDASSAGIIGSAGAMVPRTSVGVSQTAQEQTGMPLSLLKVKELAVSPDGNWVSSADVRISRPTEQGVNTG